MATANPSSFICSIALLTQHFRMASISRGLLKIRLNQDQSCFTCGMECGVAIYNISPLSRLSTIGFQTLGGVSHVEMLGRSNILAIVGGGHSPRYPERCVLIWDDKKGKIMYELAFATPVLSVRMTKERLVVVLYSEIHVFSFPSAVKLLNTFRTSPNPKGLCEICGSSKLLVYPGNQRGTLQLVDLVEGGARATDSICSVHQHDISCIAIDNRGMRVATASTKGTLVRVHSTLSRQLLAEFRRGVDTANIYSISFSLDSMFLCVSSDKGTVHIFAVDDQSLNKKSSLANVGLTQVLGKNAGTSYIESQWDLAHFTVQSETPCVCGFLPNRKAVVAICMDGTFHQYMFSADGQCHREKYDVFIDMNEEEL